MKHTECKDCELSNGDCGYHFKMDGVTNFDIPSLSACDKYGNCMFFKSKAKPKGDLISREALRKNMEFICMGIMAGTEPYDAPLTEIDNAPTVTSQALYNGIVEIISKNGITTIEELLETLKGGTKNE